MIRKSGRMIGALDMLSDGLLIMLSYYLAVYLRFDILKGRKSLTYNNPAFVMAAFVCAMIIVIALYALRVYHYGRRKSRRGQAMAITAIIGVVSLIFIAVLYVRRVSDFSRLTLVLFWLFSSIFLIGKHESIHMAAAYVRRKGYNLKHVIIVGNGHLAQQYVEDIRRNPHMGYRLCGYVSGVEREGLGKHLGSYEDLDRILEESAFDELIVALEPHEVGFMSSVMASADKAGIRLSLIPFYNDYIPSQPTIEVIDRTRLIDMRATPLDHLGWAMLKRTMDIVGSLLLILVSSPVMLAVAIGVKLSSPGPIFFAQQRVGRNKKPFKMYKFRSMRINTAQDTGWSRDVDARKTRFGSFIRKYSLDELPQFFNVLKGDMSLIGPRPEIPFHVRRFKEEVPLYLLRQQVRPGMTGWAQVHGLRGDTSIEARVKYDLWYIQNWSLRLDIRILLMTAFGGMVNNEVM